MNKKQLPKKHKIRVASELDTELASSVWLGALFFYLANAGRITFSKLWHQRYRKRNIIIGYLIKLILLIGVIYGAYKLTLNLH